MTRSPAHTRLEGACGTARRPLETLAPYVATARGAAAQYADGARQRLSPALEALGPQLTAVVDQARTGGLQAAQSARSGAGQAFAALPPQTQENAVKAVHRAQEAALHARHSAEHARAAAVPVVQEAQARGAAALLALQGNAPAPSRREACRRRKAAAKAQRAAKGGRGADRGPSASVLLTALGTLAIGSGLLLWVWYRRRSEPEWLIEPPEVQHPLNPVHPATGATAAPGSPGLNGSHPDQQPPADGEDDRDEGSGTV